MLLIKGSETNLYPEEMKAACKLRHDVFVEEKGWEDLRQEDGLETDQFDTDNALHMLKYDKDELVGYQRLLPTTSKTLLSDVYPYLCDDDLPCDPAIWEWTRFAVRKDYRKGIKKLSPTGNALLSGVVEWGLENGVHSILIQMNPVWIMQLIQFHFRTLPLGIPHKLSGENVIAVVASFDERTLARLQEVRGNNERIINSA